MEEKTVISTHVQRNFGAILERVVRGEYIIVERYRRPAAIIMPYKDYQELVKEAESNKTNQK